MNPLKKLLCKIIGHRLSDSQLWWNQWSCYSFKPAFYGKFCYRCESRLEESMPQKIKKALDSESPEEILDRLDGALLYFKRW